jgi:complex III assembly factor LYRM7
MLMTSITSSATTAFNKARVLSGYRRLFRARKVLFRDDTRALKESRFAIRSEFEKNRNISPVSLQTLDPYLIMIDEAEDMLLHGFAKGTLNKSSGNYGMYFIPE